VRAVEEAKLETPAVTIVGKVVSLRETIDWFGKRPLLGKTIVVTRTRQQASELSTQLEAMGANVLEAPTITLQPAADSQAVDAALMSAGTFDWIIFTSANDVTVAKERLAKIKGDIRLFGNAKIAAIGNATARAIERELCLKVDLLPKRFVAEALADELIANGNASGKRFLLLRADIARPLLANRLVESGAEQVADVAIYETRAVAALPTELLQALDQRQVDWVTFTSSSTAKNFVNLLGGDYQAKLNGVKIASIGPITSQSLVELKLTPTVQAEEFDIPGLVQALAEFR
jgi:uroporphyrinogen III methyltransferase/synthase